MKKLTTVAIVLTLLLATVVGTPVRAAVLEVGPGPGMYGTIQSAIDAAAPGDTIIVHAGTYNEEVVIVTDAITLRGEPGAVLQGSGAPGEIGIAVNAGVSGVTVEGFEIGDYANLGILVSDYGGDPPEPTGDSPHDNVIRKNVISGCGTGIALTNADSNAVTGNEVSGIAATGVSVVGSSSGNLVQGNKIWDAPLQGIYLAPYIYPDSPTGNLFEGNETFGGRWGILVWDAGGGNVIQGNTFSNAVDQGIIMGSFTGSPFGNTYASNVVSSMNIGIGMWGAHNNDILDNEVQVPAWVWTAVAVGSGSSGNLVSGNEVTGGDNGINVDSAHGNVVEKNDVSGSNRGINLWQANENQVLGNSILGGEFSINLGDSHGNLVSGNEVTGSAHQSIVLNNGSSDNDVEANKLSGGNDGVFVWTQAHNNRITGNEISGAAYNGVGMGDGAHDNVVSGNVISSCGDGVTLEGNWGAPPTGNEIKDNKIEDSLSNGIGVYSCYGNVLTGNEVSGGDFGVRLDNVGASQVLENEVTGCGTAGIGLLYATESEIARNQVSGNPTGISLVGGSNDNRVEDNEVDSLFGAGTNGIFVSQYLNDDAPSRNILVGNDISGGEYGIQLWEAGNANVIQGNTITGSPLTTYCIVLYVSDDVVIGDNEIAGGGSLQAIVLVYAHYNQVLRNEVKGGANVGVGVYTWSSNNTISGNEIWDCAEQGINLNGNPYSNQVVANEVRGCEAGIDLANGSFSNTVAENEVSGSRWGILVLDAATHSNHVLANEVSESVHAGIQAQFEAAGNTFEGNEVSGSGVFDLEDWANPPANIWIDNEYDTSSF
jgi:parallel beta-helix repeat protein